MTTRPKLQRLPDWQERLHAFLNSRAATAFEWGRHDCSLFAADAAHAITGTDPLPAAWRKHRSALAAQRLQAKHGGLQAMVTGLLGEPVAPLLARVGDVGLLPHAGGPGSGPLLAVCGGAHWLAAAAVGVAVLPLQQAELAWRVG